MFGLSPMLLLVIVLGASLPITYGVTKVKAVFEARASYDKGLEAGKGQASTATVDAATKTAQAGREAEQSVTHTANRAARIAACKADPACRQRGEALAGDLK